MRTCVICRTKNPKNMLLRYICPGNQQKELILDPKGTAPGRGFYTCNKDECVKKIGRFRGWIHKCKGGINNVR
ncbi:MAG: YlxR family protein [Desulfonatronovibrio sp.]